MTDQQTAGSGQAPATPRARNSAAQPPAAQPPAAQTLSAQRAVNRLVRGLLRTPVISRGVGRKLVTLYLTGRKSGRRYVIPVAYARQGADLLIGTPFGWGRNLRSGEPVTIRLQGRLRQADVIVAADEAGVTAAYAVMCAGNRNFARFNKIGFTADGRPEPDDLHRAWAEGARAFRLTPR